MCEPIPYSGGVMSGKPDWQDDEVFELREKLQAALKDANAMRLANRQLLACLKRYIDKYGPLS